MDQPSAVWSPAQSSALEFIWGEYRVWAATARDQKAQLFSWRLRVLLLTAVGALLGTLSNQITGVGTAASSWLSPRTLLGGLGGISVALATFFSREILQPERERRWIRARSMAEALKAESYFFRTGVPPYDAADAAPKVIERTNALLKMVRDVQTVVLPAEQRRERLVQGPLLVSQYIEERVDDQIDNFYRPRSIEYEAMMSRGRAASLVLGALAAILGTFSASGWTAGWVAVITTTTASVAAYLYAGRFQYLIVSYQATARQLEVLKTQWIVMGQPETDPAKRSWFVQDCEAAISIENNAWMSRSLGETSKTAQEADPAVKNLAH